jgi:hypothetical protein
MFDPILLWNEVSLEANRVSHTNGLNEQTGPTLSSRALAIVHLAMYDAYAGVIDDPANLPRYLPVPPAPPAPGMGASATAAVAAAAHGTLAALFPSQKAYFDLVLAIAGDPADSGHEFGVEVAKQLLADRAGDPPASTPGYTPSNERGHHRADPDNPGQGYHAPVYGALSKGFAITHRFELAPPPFDDAEYLEALRQVRGKGIAPELMGTLPPGIEGRTVDETVIGVFWAYDGVARLGTPPRLYNQIVRRVAEARGNSVAANARLFAFVNAAMADAGILSWDQKYIHDLWRPVVGIREHDTSMGPGATEPEDNVSDDCDTAWLPLGAPRTNPAPPPANRKNFTPPFPAYPSGHATFGAAALHITRLFYGVAAGDRGPDTVFTDSAMMPLTLVSDELDGINTDNQDSVRPRHLRAFDDGLWQMILENGRSRVFLGVHWIFDAFVVDEDGNPDLTRTSGTDSAGNPRYFGGVPLGLQIAEDIFQAGGGKAPVKSPVGPR